MLSRCLPATTAGDSTAGDSAWVAKEQEFGRLRKLVAIELGGLGQVGQRTDVSLSH